MSLENIKICDEILAKTNLDTLNNRQKCNLILSMMIAVGHEVIETCDSLSDDDIVYTLVNYSKSYLKQEYKKDDSVKDDYVD